METSRERKILLLKGKDSSEQVLEALGLKGDVDLVERAELALASIFEALGQGLCLLNGQGQTVWANAKIRALPQDVQEQLRIACLREAGSAGGEAFRSRRFALSCRDMHFEITTVPLLSAGAGEQLVVIVADTTRARNLQERLDAIDRAGSELVRLDIDDADQMDVAARLRLLEQRIIRYTLQLLRYDKFIIRLLDPETGRLELVLASGMSPEAEAIEIFASTEGNGISGYVAATGRSYICHDVPSDPLYLPGLENARSSLTVPLRLHDRVVGIFNIEADRTAAFTEEDRQIAEIFGRYIAIALNMLQLIVTERSAAREQTARDLAAQLAGPLNDILADAATLMDQYIAHDDLLARLKEICKNVHRVKQQVQQAERQTTIAIGQLPQKREAEPLLADKRLLVADDEPVIRQTLHDVLTSLGCCVETAKDGNEAISLITQQEAYDLIICDVKMPGRNGYQVFATVKDKNPDVPVIFMTGFGYDPNHSIIRARREGLNAVLFKPFKVDELLDAVREALQQTQPK